MARNYEGYARECACGHYTNVHGLCAHCETRICEACGIYGDSTTDYCSTACRDEAETLCLDYAAAYKRRSNRRAA